jgi:hypothetical protein
MTRVLSTSNGVVSAAATPPAMLPHTAASRACNDFLPNFRANCSFRNSYRGNCNEVKGIWNHVRRVVARNRKCRLTSRMTVVPKPLYKPKIPSRVKMVLKANIDDCPSSPYADVCVRVLTTSVGTRIMHAACDL